MKADLFADQIPFLKPWLGEEEAAAVREVILSGWVSLGPKVAEFERAIADLVGAKEGVATTAATNALHLGMIVAGVQPGDDVICPSFTCRATANAVLLAGGKVRFADIDRRTYNLDPNDVQARLTPQTRAIMLVDQIGLPGPYDEFAELCAKRNLILIEDAATALGGSYKGKPLGGSGAPTAFSFHPRKMITTGEGGMLMLNDSEWAARARVLRSAGASVSDLVRHQAKGTIVQEYTEAGFNYRMTDMHAAVGLAQLQKLPEMLSARRRQAGFYDAALSDIDEVEPPYVPDYAEHSYSSYCIRVRPSCPVDAHTLVVRMAERGISCRHGIQPLHTEPYFRASMAGLSLPESEAAAHDTLFLPIFPGLTEAQQWTVVQGLKESVGR